MKNKKIYILAICLAVIFTGRSVNLAKKVNVPEITPEVKKDPVVNNVATTTEKVTTSAAESVTQNQEDTNLDPKNWKVYSDSAHGFELKIPQKEAYVQAYTLDEIKVYVEKEMKDYLVEGGMSPGYLFPEMNDGRVKNDIEAWQLGKRIYENKDEYKDDLYYVRCKKDKTIFDSCFFLSQEGGAALYEKILYHNNVRISLEIALPNDRFFAAPGNKGMSDLLSSYIRGDFTENEKKDVDVMNKIVSSLKFTK